MGKPSPSNMLTSEPKAEKPKKSDHQKRTTFPGREACQDCAPRARGSKQKVALSGDSKDAKDFLPSSRPPPFWEYPTQFTVLQKGQPVCHRTSPNTNQTQLIELEVGT